jgi:hypothetical protein
MRVHVAAFATLLPLALTGVGGALAADAATKANTPAATRTFVGLWEAVDPNDGSLTQRSITCEGPEACQVLGADTFFTFCNGSRGLLQGTGSIAKGVLSVPNFTLTCFETGHSVPAATTFEPDRRNGTLVQHSSNPQIKPITFHKISQP